MITSLFKRRPELGSRIALRDIDRAQQELKRKARARLDVLSSNIKTVSNLGDDIAQAFPYIEHVGAAIQTLEDIKRIAAVTTRKVTDLPTYLVSDIFLLENHRYLLSDPEHRERMVTVTGPLTQDGTRVLSTMLKMRMAEQSAVYVKAHEGALAALWDDITTNHGHEIWGIFHSHILHGKTSTKPSATDIKHQQRLVNFGMPHTLGGIFNVDGWVRIFSTAQDFSLSTYGSSVELVEDRPREKILKLNLKETIDVVIQED